LSGCTSTEGEQPSPKETSQTVAPIEEVPVQPVYTEEETYIGTISNMDNCPGYSPEKPEEILTLCVYFKDGRQMKVQPIAAYPEGKSPIEKSIILIDGAIPFGYAQIGRTYKMHLTKSRDGIWIMDGFREA